MLRQSQRCVLSENSFTTAQAIQRVGTHFCSFSKLQRWLVSADRHRRGTSKHVSLDFAHQRVLRCIVQRHSIGCCCFVVVFGSSRRTAKRRRRVQCSLALQMQRTKTDLTVNVCEKRRFSLSRPRTTARLASRIRVRQVSTYLHILGKLRLRTRPDTRRTFQLSRRLDSSASADQPATSMPIGCLYPTTAVHLSLHRFHPEFFEETFSEQSSFLWRARARSLAKHRIAFKNFQFYSKPTLSKTASSKCHLYESVNQAQHVRCLTLIMKYQSTNSHCKTKRSQQARRTTATNVSEHIGLHSSTYTSPPSLSSRRSTRPKRTRECRQSCVALCACVRTVVACATTACFHSCLC
jgi:hypothetical protein